jgi:hypothetical protein
MARRFICQYPVLCIVDPVLRIVDEVKLVVPARLWGKLVEFLPQRLARIFHSIRVIVIPLGPTRGNRLKSCVHESALPEVPEHLGVFVILNAITKRLQPYPRRRLC